MIAPREAMEVVQTEPAPGTDALIASLRESGAARFDPVRMRYLETLAARARACEGSMAQALSARLKQVLDEFAARFEAARREAAELAAEAVRQHADARSLQRMLDEGDLRGVRRATVALARQVSSPSLAEIVRELDQSAVESPDAATDKNPPSHPELRAIREFRSTWSRLSVDNQVTQALAQAPKNAGPINSHMLVLRSLALMREVSPDYLNRFMSYTETLLCLEQNEIEKAEKPKKKQVAKGGRK